MKVNIIPTKKLALLSATFCAVMLTFSHNASAFALGFFPDPHVVGTVTPDTPASETHEAAYINFMITLGLGDSGTFLGNTIARSTNVFANLPTASPIFSGRGTGNIVDTGGPPNVYSYILAKYDGQNDFSQVWYIGDLIDEGVFEIPLLGPNGHMLSHWTLFASGPPVGVPDGGATIMLLGGALGALGMARRFLMR